MRGEKQRDLLDELWNKLWLLRRHDKVIEDQVAVRHLTVLLGLALSRNLTYMMTEVSIHDDHETACTEIQSMDVCGSKS